MPLPTNSASGNPTAIPVSATFYGPESRQSTIICSSSIPPDLGHEGEEAFFVVQGRVRVNIGDESHVLEVGDSVHWAAALPHQTINIGEEKAKLIFARTPPGFRDLRFIENEIGAP
jgi:mannose-6-phosphate isomerase-like protein (cupin superfamily)